MLNRFKAWRKRREEAYDFQEKARLCKPCDKFCGRDLCRKVGCLNMDMRTNSTRLGFLVMRLEDAGYVFTTEEKKEEPETDANVVNLADFRKK